MAQATAAWTISSISVTPIPPNPTNTQINFPEGPESTLETSLQDNQHSTFLHYLLLNLGGNPVESQEPFGKSKQPSINIQLSSQAHVRYKKRLMVGKEKDH
ncbi:hypothetical protein O181_004021 [Austropuccinia psidii MF-1]|uniref:Uncharacterized protein n=1 Tax=Austropuccinia psidii MF-1 TaxID=1389203 RepID=A0A9Q3GEN2_9BASI|nr:hypothetical protein [Austropuccinia psidii MF-1]